MILCYLPTITEKKDILNKTESETSGQAFL